MKIYNTKARKSYTCINTTEEWREYIAAFLANRGLAKLQSEDFPACPLNSEGGNARVLTSRFTNECRGQGWEENHIQDAREFIQAGNYAHAVLTMSAFYEENEDDNIFGLVDELNQMGETLPDWWTDESTTPPPWWNHLADPDAMPALKRRFWDECLKQGNNREDAVLFLQQCQKCINGGQITWLIYHADTIALHDDHESEIWTWLEEVRDREGHKHVIETISTFGFADKMETMDMLKSWLVFAYCEACAADILSELGE